MSTGGYRTEEKHVETALRILEREAATVLKEFARRLRNHGRHLTRLQEVCEIPRADSSTTVVASSKECESVENLRSVNGI
jgi:hypothetical protein